MKNIIISFDGTWNIPDIKSNMEDSTSTNVFKLHQAIETATATATAQVKWYDTGVGTQWYDRLSGGIFGVGLSANIIQGYTALIDNYESGDRLFILGFSRGAYSARSLVGLIRNSGLLKKEIKTGLTKRINFIAIVIKARIPNMRSCFVIPIPRKSIFISSAFGTPSGH